MGDNEYKISLGVDLDTSDIKRQLNVLADNTHRIRIDVDESRFLKQVDHIKRELRDLNKGNNKNLLTLNTSKLESSLTDVKSVITDIRNTLGTIDNSKGIDSLVSSVSQISKVLDNASNKIESLSVELSALSKKDFSINLDIDMGKKILIPLGMVVRQENK